MKIAIYCECGEELVVREEHIGDDGSLVITVDPCKSCMERQDEQSYDEGYWDGREGLHRRARWLLGY